MAEVGLYGTTQAGGTEPIRDSTLFQAGTMGVPALQVAALRLAVQGKLDLDRPANAYLGEEAIPDGPNGWGGRITVRDLLRDTTGYGFSKSAGLPPGAATAPWRVENAPEAEPGREERVSSTNVALLERVVARATGRPAADVVADEVFQPLGMRDSTYLPFPPGTATGHYSGGEPTLDGHHVYPDALGNGLWTSVRDWSLFMAEMNALAGGRPSRLLDEKGRELLVRVETPKSLLGLRRDEKGGLYLGGDSYGYFCETFLRPNEETGVVVLQNRMMAWPVANAVRDAVFAIPASPMNLALPRYGGGTLSLDAARAGWPLVVFFLNEQCGVTVFYKDRLRKLEQDFAAKGFRFVAVRTGRKTPPVVLPERAYLEMPFLDDADGVLMRRFGVGQSMTFVVLDRAGRVRFQGGLDDSVDEKRVRRTPLRDALVALAAGRPVRTPRAPALGCAILPVEP